MTLQWRHEVADTNAVTDRCKIEDKKPKIDSKVTGIRGQVEKKFVKTRTGGRLFNLKISKWFRYPFPIFLYDFYEIIFQPIFLHVS